MSDDGLTPEQRREVDALNEELHAHVSRVGLDLRTALRGINEVYPPERRDDASGESYTMAFTIDFSGIVETLRNLPDGAGTTAFIAAYNRDHPDWRRGPTH